MARSALAGSSNNLLLLASMPAVCEMSNRVVATEIPQDIVSKLFISEKVHLSNLGLMLTSMWAVQVIGTCGRGSNLTASMPPHPSTCLEA